MTINYYVMLHFYHYTHMVYFDSLETGAWFENELPQSTLQLEIKYRILSASIS
jgi:hypothetical protein